jgi:hypothetical protein
VFLRREQLMRLFGNRVFFFATLVLSLLGIIDFAQLAHSKGNGLHNVRYWDIVIGEYNQYRQFNRDLVAEKRSHQLSAEYREYYKGDI